MLLVALIGTAGCESRPREVAQTAGALTVDAGPSGSSWISLSGTLQYRVLAVRASFDDHVEVVVEFDNHAAGVLRQEKLSADAIRLQSAAGELQLHSLSVGRAKPYLLPPGKTKVSYLFEKSPSLTAKTVEAQPKLLFSTSVVAP